MHDDLAAFEAAAPALFGLAYRMLGSRADAEDAVQDTFLLWQGAQRGDIRNAAAWLTTACTHRCLDMLRAGHRARTDYIGAWLPEPLQMPEGAGAEETGELASTLTTAFLLMLERLTPKEHAAYLLHEIFALDYQAIAETLGLREAACRKLVSRARGHVDEAKVRHAPPPEVQDRLLAAFAEAVTTGRPDGLAALLSREIRLSADGGGKVTTVLQPVEGAADVLTFLCGQLHDFWSDYDWSRAELNAGRGFILRQSGGAVVAAVTFAYDAAGLATGIFIMRNPDKLAWLDSVPAP